MGSAGLGAGRPITTRIVVLCTVAAVTIFGSVTAIANAHTGTDRVGRGVTQAPDPSASPSPTLPVEPGQCADGIDNDADGKIDLLQDGGCLSALDQLEGGPSPLCGTPNVICGGPADNQFKGDASANIFFGGAGDDLIIGAGGADVIRGGPGDDVLKGQAGPDALFGGPGTDTCIGGVGIDKLDRCESKSEEG